MGIIKLFQDNVAQVLTNEKIAIDRKMKNLLDDELDSSFHDNFQMMLAILPDEVFRKNRAATIYDSVHQFFLLNGDHHDAINNRIDTSPLRKLFDSDVKLAVSLQEWKIRKKKKILQKIKLELCRRENPSLFKKYSGAAKKLRQTRDMIDTMFANKARSEYTKRYGAGLPSTKQSATITHIETRKREAESNALGVSRSTRTIR